MGLVITALSGRVGLFVANYAVQCNTLWLAPDALRLRTTRLFTRTTKSFSKVNLRAFGYAGFSHGGPVCGEMGTERATCWHPTYAPTGLNNCSPNSRSTDIRCRSKTSSEQRRAPCPRSLRR